MKYTKKHLAALDGCLPEMLGRVIGYMREVHNFDAPFPSEKVSAEESERLMAIIEPAAVIEFELAYRPGGIKTLENRVWWKLGDAMVASVRLLTAKGITIQFKERSDEPATRARRDGQPQARHQRAQRPVAARKADAGT
jgi:hypothetical protein